MRLWQLAGFILIAQVVHAEDPPAVPPVATAPPAEASPSQTAPAPQLPVTSTVGEVVRRRDPFRKPVELFQKTQEKPKSELESFAVSDFKLLGVMTGPKHVRAMLQIPTGGTQFVKVKDKIGIQGGVVTSITPEKVVIREKVLNFIGEEESILTEIRLPEEKKIQVSGSGTPAASNHPSMMPTSNPNVFQRLIEAARPSPAPMQAPASEPPPLPGSTNTPTGIVGVAPPAAAPAPEPAINNPANLKTISGTNKKQ